MPPGGHGFWPIKFILAIFVEGHLVTNSAKLFSILTICCRKEDVENYLYTVKPV